MNELTLNNGQAMTAATLNGSAYTDFIRFLDAKPKTIETYKKALRQFALWTAEQGIKNPTPEDIRRYRDDLMIHCKPATVQAYIFTVRRFFEWTAASGLYPNVAGKIKGAKISREPKKDYLTSAQAKAVLNTIPRGTAQGKRDYAIVTLMLTCGLRDIEVSRANIEDIRTVADNTVLYIQGKGKDERADYVIIPAQTEQAIRAYLNTRRNAEPSAPLFVSVSNNNAGGRMTTRAISGICKSAMQAAGFNSDRLTAHSLRHTAVTLALIANKGDIQAAQQFARHSNIATTQIYAHNLEKANNTCSRLVAAAIF